MQYTRPLAECNSKDVNLVGGKAASLGALLEAGLPVPDGFVVTTEYTSGAQDSEADTLRAVVEAQILEAFDLLVAGSENKTVAVRSSATVEDGSKDSWAGQFDSFLFVTREDLLEKIKQCINSVHAPRVAVYAQHKGIPVSGIKIAVVVQRMVDADISGVAFSVHPVTEDDRTLYIEAVKGVGESLVSGSVTPESYTVNKIDLSYETNSTGEPSNNLLPADQVRKLSSVVTYIERFFGFPCDIEWVYKEGKFWIVQSRPITTLK